MVGTIDQRGLRFHREMLGFCAVLFLYMLGLLTWTLQLGAQYSLLKWIVIGVLVAGSAALLTWQVSQVRRLCDEQSPGPGREVNGSEGDLSEPRP